MKFIFLRILPLLLLFLSGVQSLAQTNLDSLWSVWNNPAESDTNRLKAIHSYNMEKYLFVDADSAFHIAQQQYAFALGKNLKKQQATALNTIGISYYFRGAYDSAITYYTSSMALRKEIGDKVGVAAAYNNIGMVHYEQGQYDQTISYLTESLAIEEELHNEQGVASTYNNIGLVYKDLGEYDKALSYYNKSLVLQKKLKNELEYSNALNNIGVVYLNQGQYAEALKFFKECKTIVEKDGESLSLAMIYHNVGLIYSDQDSLLKALDYFNNALLMQQALDDPQGVSGTLNEIGSIFYKQKKYKLALESSLEALKIAEGIGAAVEVKNAANSLHRIYDALGNKGKALEMYKRFHAAKDSIEREENKSEIFRQEFKYEYDKKAAADSVRNALAQRVQDAEDLAKQRLIDSQRQESYYLYGGLALALLFGGVIFNRFRISKQQNRTIEKQKLQVDQAYTILEVKSKEILDSISYARRIQTAILPSKEVLEGAFNDFFILYKPKDIVAGDFYWIHQLEATNGQTGGLLFAVADCTGHGVSGAMVSVVCNNALNRSVREYGLNMPSDILDKTREIVIAEFDKSKEDVKDGMDIALCALHGSQLHFSGAHRPLWIVRDGAVIEIKGDVQPIGKYRKQAPFKSHTVELQANDLIYLFTDGFTDQFGGPNDRKFMTSNFGKLVLSLQDQSLSEQKKSFNEAFRSWKGRANQIDDVCVMALRIQ